MKQSQHAWNKMKTHKADQHRQKPTHQIKTTPQKNLHAKPTTKWKTFIIGHWDPLSFDTSFRVEFTASRFCSVIIKGNIHFQVRRKDHLWDKQHLWNNYLIYVYLLIASLPASCWILRLWYFLQEFICLTVGTITNSQQLLWTIIHGVM